MSIEEADELRDKVYQLEKDKELLEADALKTARKENVLNKNIEDKNEIIRKLQRELELEKKRRAWIGDGLKGANYELENRKKDIHELMRRNRELRKFWKISCTKETRLREQLEIERQEFQEGLEEERQGFQEELETEQQRYQDMKEDYEDLLRLERKAWETELETTQFNFNLERGKIENLRGIVNYYRTHSEEFRQKSDHWASSYNDLVEQVENGELYQALQDERDIWMDRSDKLTMLANGMLEEVLNKLKAENGVVLPWVTPDNIQKFLECCNDLVKELKRKIRRH